MATRNLAGWPRLLRNLGPGGGIRSIHEYSYVGVSGSAGITLGGGEGGSSNDDLSLVAKAKAGDYGGENGWNASVDLGWQGGSHGDSGFSLGLGGDFSTNTDGDLDTNLTRDEFGINADGGGGGNDWFNTNYDSKAHVVSDTVEGHSTYHSEHDSTGHEDSGVVSDSDSSFTFELSKPTGGDVTGSFGFTFEGGSGDNWHVKNNCVDKWKNTYDDGSGCVEIY